MLPLAFFVSVAAVVLPSDTRPFPMRVVSADGGGLRLELLPAAESLRTRERLDLVAMPLPGGAQLDLELERVRVLRPGALFRIDDTTLPSAELGSRLTMWSGRVLGEADSDVFLAFTPTGSRGWIRRGADTTHLLAEPDGTSRLTHEADLLALDPVLAQKGNWTCGVSEAHKRLPTYPTGGPSRAPSFEGVQAFLPILECRIAIETDTQYTQNFGGDLSAAEDYLLSLFGAISSRYREQMGIVFSIVYTQLYSGPDPWMTQETGGDGFDLIFEFIDAWENGQAPVAADLFFLNGGTQIVPALGFFQGLCNPDIQFAVGNRMDGSTPFPVTQGPLSWNFIVAAHEMGHVFGASHTHDYCPPLDQCSPAFGPCQTQQVCVSTGTVMSYCNQCPGFAANYTTYFHPDVANIIRGFAEDLGCLRPLDGVFTNDLGNGLAGAGGTPVLDVTFDSTSSSLLLSHTNAPPSASATVYLSSVRVDTPYFGGIRVPAPDVIAPFVTPGASDFVFSVAVPDSLSAILPMTPPGVAGGVDLFAQTWFSDAGGPQGFSATNATGFELILADPPPAPVWIARPGTRKEYALSHRGTWDAVRAQAQAAGGELVSVRSQALNNWIVATFGVPNARSVYVGLNDTATEGSFTWSSGAASGYTNWGTGQPNNDSAGGQDYVELFLRTETLIHEDDVVLSAGAWNDTVGTAWLTNRGLMERDRRPRNARYRKEER